MNTIKIVRKILYNNKGKAMQHNGESLFELIRYEDLEGDIKEVAELLGIDTARRLIEYFSSSLLYIPKLAYLSKFTRRVIPMLIQKGYSTKRIAQMLGCSESHIRNILRSLGKGEA